MIREKIEIKNRVEFTLLYAGNGRKSYRHNISADFESYFKVVLVSD